MALDFPSSPANGNTFVSDNVTYTYNESKGVWYTSSVLYTTPDVNLSSVGQNVIPSTNETYNLGSADFKWKDLYLSGNTLVLGTIALKDSNGTFTTTTVESNGYIIPSETPVGTGVGGSVSPAKNIIFSMVFGGMQ